MPQQIANLAQVYRQYVHLVRGQIRRFTRDEQAIDALTEEVFVRFWRRHGRSLTTSPQVGEILWRLALQSAGSMSRGRRRPGTRWRRFLARSAAASLALQAPPAAVVPAGCLGNLAVALVGAHERLPSAAELRHLQACPGCQRRLSGERAAVLKAAVLPLPPDLVALCPAPRPHAATTPVGWRAWLSVLAMLGACVGGAAVLPRRGPEEPLLQAHSLGYVLAVVRRADGSQRVLPLATSAGATLQVGEQLRLHVAWPAPANVCLRGRRDGVSFYEGRLPADGWLPVSVEGQGSVPPPLELSLCPQEGDGGCWTRPIL